MEPRTYSVCYRSCGDYRLILREDNADMPLNRERRELVFCGLMNVAAFCKKREAIELESTTIKIKLDCT